MEQLRKRRMGVYWIGVGLVCGFFLLVTGCASTKLVESWQDEAFTSAPLKRILVLGLFKSETHRRVWEDGLVNALAARNTKGMAGYSLMPDVKDYDEKEDIENAVKQTGADGVIIARFMGVEKQTRTVPSRVDYHPVPRGRYGLYRYYGSSFETVYYPGYTVEDKVLSLEVALFSTQSRTMVWGGTTQTLNPKAGERIAKEAAQVVIDDMQKAGLL